MEFLALFEQRSNRDDNAGISLDEATIEVGEAKEDLDIADANGDRPFDNSGDAAGFHRNAVGGNDEAKEVDFVDMELTLLKVDE